MGRIKDKGLYPLKNSPVLDDYVIGTDFESGETITFALSSIIGTASTISDDNKFQEINYGKVIWDGITSPDIAAAINSIPVSIEVLFDEIAFFNGVVHDGTRSYYNSYIITGKGKGTYGVGGNITVTSSDLVIISSTLITHEDYVLEDLNAVLTDLGDITGVTLLDTLNGLTPFVITADENRYWKYLDTGIEYIYGFDGAAGTYGAAQPPILIAELFLVKDAASVIVTKTSDLGNDGSDATSTYVETDELGTVAFDNDYGSLDNTPAVPTLQSVIDVGSTASSADVLSSYIMDISEGAAGFFRVKMDNVGVTRSNQLWADFNFVRMSGFGITSKDAEVKIDNGLLTLQQSSAANATNIGFITPTAVVTYNFPAKSIGTYTIAMLSDVTASSGLETIDEGNGDGLAIVGRDPADFGNIGLDAVDLSVYGTGTEGALGTASVAFSSHNIAGAYCSATFGESNNIPSGADYSFAAGDVNVFASAAYSSAAFGRQNALNSSLTFVANLNNSANGSESAVFGRDNFSQSFGEFIVGVYGTDYVRTAGNDFTWDAADRILNVGIGTSTGARADAFTILKSGYTGIGYNNFEATANTEILQVNGAIRTQFNSTSEVLPLLIVDQLGTGDAYQEFRVVGQSFTMGIDNSDSDSFKMGMGNINTLTYLKANPASGLIQLGDISNSDRTVELVGFAQSSFIRLLEEQTDFILDDGVTSVINNNANITTASGGAGFLINQLGAGDALLGFKVAATEWTMGIDNSVSDEFRISLGDGLGTTNKFAIATSGQATINSTGGGLSLNTAEGSQHISVFAGGNEIMIWNHDPTGFGGNFTIGDIDIVDTGQVFDIDFGAEEFVFTNGNIRLSEGNSITARKAHATTTSASYTPLASQREGNLTLTLADADITIPLNASTVFNIGTELNVWFTGTGTHDIIEEGGVTINSSDGLTGHAQYSHFTFVKTATDVWTMSKSAIPETFKVKLTLSASEINAIGTTPIEIVPAQGAGTIINLISATGFLDWNAVAFDNNTLDLELAGVSSNQMQFSNNWLNLTADTFNRAAYSQGLSKHLANSALQVKGTDSVATGDSTIDVYITYEVITL